MSKKQKKPKEKKALRELFKDSLNEVSKYLDKVIVNISRDEYLSTAIKYGIVKLNKKELNNLGGFKVLKDLLIKEIPAEIPQVLEEVKTISIEDTKNILLSSFRDYIIGNGKIPTIAELEQLSGIKQAVIRSLYTNYQDIFTEVRKVFSEVDNFIFNETSFNKEYYDDLQNKIKSYKRFIITTAVSGKKADINFLNSLKNYAKRNDALILILPCEDVSNRKSVYEWDFDPKLREFGVVYKDTPLNDNLTINTIKVSAKQILPTTGLDRLAVKSSIILASPKQFLKFIPNSKNKTPKCIMTTGAITEANYDSDFYMSKRTSRIAEQDHMLGAIVVEIEDDAIYYFRQIQASETKSITDLGIEYHSNGSETYCEDTVAILGDSHISKMDVNVHKTIKDILTFHNINDVVLHDCFDAESISHHNIGRPTILAMNANVDKSSLYKEGVGLAKYLEDLNTVIDGKIVVVASNHNEALNKYLVEGRFINDPPNMYLSLDLCKALMESKNPLQYLIEDKVGLDETVKVKWLNRDEDWVYHGVEVGHHGDISANGSRGNITNFECAYEKSVIGHKHSASIFRGVYVVGVSGKMDMGYNVGMSSWTHSLVLIYSSGVRQIISTFKDKDGNYKWKL